MQSAINNETKNGVNTDERKRFRKNTHIHNTLPSEPIDISKNIIHVHGSTIIFKLKIKKNFYALLYMMFILKR